MKGECEGEQSECEGNGGEGEGEREGEWFQKQHGRVSRT